MEVIGNRFKGNCLIFIIFGSVFSVVGILAGYSIFDVGDLKTKLIGTIVIAIFGGAGFLMLVYGIYSLMQKFKPNELIILNDDTLILNIYNREIKQNEEITFKYDEIKEVKTKNEIRTNNINHGSLVVINNYGEEIVLQHVLDVYNVRKRIESWRRSY